SGFLWKAGRPTFGVAAGTYSVDQTVMLRSATPSATIHYTTNGTDPNESDPAVASGDSVVVSAPATLKARAYAAGTAPSDVTSVIYAFKVATPTMTPAGGTYSEPQLVTLATVTTGAEIHYTVDGSDPTAGSPLYAAPIAVNSNLTLKALGLRAGWQASDTA